MMRHLHPLLPLLLACLLLASVPAQHAAADDLIADLSKHQVAITAGFTGTSVLVFGTVEPGSEVAVVIRGPSTAVTMRRKSRIAGVWVNSAAKTFSQVPSFYSVTTSTSLERLAPPAVLDRNGIGLNAVDLPEIMALQPRAEVKRWRAALIRAKQRKQLYNHETSQVVFSSPRLFRTRVPLPTNVPTGTYVIQVYAFEDGRVVQARTRTLRVAKAGLEAEISWFAEQRPAAYAAIALMIALVIGWFGDLMFRRD